MKNDKLLISFNQFSDYYNRTIWCDPWYTALFRNHINFNILIHQFESIKIFPKYEQKPKPI